jgi:hypothetical protein
MAEFTPSLDKTDSREEFLCELYVGIDKTDSRPVCNGVARPLRVEQLRREKSRNDECVHAQGKEEYTADDKWTWEEDWEYRRPFAIQATRSETVRSTAAQRIAQGIMEVMQHRSIWYEHKTLRRKFLTDTHTEVCILSAEVESLVEAIQGN